MLIQNSAYHLTIQDNGKATVSHDDFWTGSESDPYEAGYNTKLGVFYFAWFDAYFSFDGANVTATGGFYIEGQKHNVTLSRIFD